MITIYKNKCFTLTLIPKILILFSFFFIPFNNKIENQNKNKGNDYLKGIINKLNSFAEIRKPEYIIFSDYFLSKYCSDINAYTVFKYYLKQNYTNAYYIINIESELFKNLNEHNETKNLILINNTENIFDNLFHYILNSKILVQSYLLYDFQYIINNVPYLKYFYINHGITYFKSNFISPEFRYVKEEKRNIITSSPYEYNILLNKFNYSPSYIYKAGIARYDAYKTLEINKSENDCILITFTYRMYNKSIFENSSYKRNLEKLLNEKSLIKFLMEKKIELIYVPHHNELFLNKTLQQKKFNYAKIVGQNDLTQYIKKCSLLVTDFSSISFAFMFLYKPILFYLIDYEDKSKIKEKNCMDPNNKLYFGNSFLKQELLIDKIKYYVRKNYKIKKSLKRKYESVFYYRENITVRIFNIINGLIS